jgi:hypothetical protein
MRYGGMCALRSLQCAESVMGIEVLAHSKLGFNPCETSPEGPSYSAHRRGRASGLFPLDLDSPAKEELY